MPKYVVKEGILDKFINSFFDSYKKNRINQMKSKLSKDPKLKKLVDDAAERMDRIEKHIEKNTLKDPAAKAYYDRLMGK